MTSMNAIPAKPVCARTGSRSASVITVQSGLKIPQVAARQKKDIL
jgi:hypothetical protein